MSNNPYLRKLYLATFYTGILLLLNAPAYANTCNEGIGGTGHEDTTHTHKSNNTDKPSSTSDGLGGTGIVAETEGLGGTGIVGAITGFASICVNGLEVHFDDSTQVEVDGEVSSLDKLNIGELVAIDARGQGTELKALHVSVMHAIVGQIDEIITTKQQLKIMGQTVQLSSLTLGASNLKVGQNVAISGLAGANGVIQALRTDVVADTMPALITGSLADGKISGVLVTMLSNSPSNANVQASGQWDGKALITSEVKQSAMDRVMQAGYVFDIQGVVDQSGYGKALYILGKQVYIDSTTKVYGDKNLKNAAVIVRGKIDSEGRAVARDVDYRPLGKTLERGGGKQRPTDRQEIKKNELMHEKAGHQGKPEKVEIHDKIEKTDRPEKTEKLEKIEKLEKVQVPEHIERPERTGVAEKIEKPELHTR